MNVTQLQHAVELHRAALDAAIEERNRAVKARRDQGATIYALAAEMGVTQGAVRAMLGLTTRGKR